MSGGYMGKMLFADLTEGRTWDEPTDDNLCRDFIGGYGLGARLIFQRQKARTDPLGPDAILGFVTGPLTGTPALIGSRYVVVGKSPLTGTWGDANSGGDFGPHLKFAGYDAAFFVGASDRPVYLHINDGKATLRKAEHLWGRDSHDTQDMLQTELGKDTRVACIGPSGEKLSLISCVVNNKGRVAARSGLGALMGAKKLKAIAVNGKRTVPLAHESELQEARKKYLEQLRGSIIYTLYRESGTAGGMEFLNLTGEAPLKNWGGIPTVDLQDITPLTGPTVNSMREKKYGCWHCPISCGGLMKAGSGPYKYAAGVHQPEYETLAAFGNMCLNNNIESVMMATDICNRYGLDSISAGTTIAFAIECYENGLVTKKDTDGIELRWGNHKAIVAMTQRLAERRGLGDILADGVKVAAKRIGRGSEKFAIHIQGQEPGLHDPKAGVSFVSAFLDPTPGRHTQGNDWLTTQGLPFPQFDPMSCSGRGEVQRMASNFNHVMQSAGICLMGYMCLDAQHVPDFLNLVTGSNHTFDDVLRIGERIANIRQAFNVREGVSTSDYAFPDRVLGRPPPTAGPTAGRQVDLETLRRDYFQAMSWDTTSGKPGKRKLVELGLADVAKALWPE